MATAGPRYPGTTASETGPSGDNDWISTSPISADDGSEAQITAATYDAGDHSFRLKATNFGFSADVPAGSTINGITVEIDRRCFAGAAQDQEVRLYDSTGTLVGDDKQTATAWPATLGIATYGGASDTWASGLDADDIRSAGFGVALIVLADGANTDIGVDFIRVTITYTAPVPTGTGAIGVPPATVSGTGSLILTGTGAVTLPAATVAGTGAEVFTATGAVSVSPSSVAGVGDHTLAEPTATGTISVPAATVSGTGELSLIATGAIAVSPAAVAGLGSEVFTGTGAVSVPTVAVNGAGLLIVNVTGTGAITVPSVVVEGSGSGGEDESGIPAMGQAGYFRSLAVAAAITGLKKKLNKELNEWLDWWD